MIAEAVGTRNNRTHSVIDLENGIKEPLKLCRADAVQL